MKQLSLHPVVSYLAAYSVFLVPPLLSVILLVLPVHHLWDFLVLLDDVATMYLGPFTLGLSPSAGLYSDISAYFNTIVEGNLTVAEIHKVIEQVLGTLTQRKLSLLVCYRAKWVALIFFSNMLTCLSQCSLFTDESWRKFKPYDFPKLLLWEQLEGPEVFRLPPAVLGYFDKAVCPIVAERLAFFFS